MTHEESSRKDPGVNTSQRHNRKMTLGITTKALLLTLFSLSSLGLYPTDALAGGEGRFKGSLIYSPGTDARYMYDGRSAVKAFCGGIDNLALKYEKAAKRETTVRSDWDKAELKVRKDVEKIYFKYTFRNHDYAPGKERFREGWNRGLKDCEKESAFFHE